MSAISAKNSLVSTGSAVACTKIWTLDSTEDLQAYACSVTRGGVGRVDGIKDWSGSFTAYGDTPPVVVGDSIGTLTLVMSGSPGSQVGFSGPAIVTRVEARIDIEGGKTNEYTVTFSGNGAGAFSAALNITAPTSFPSPTSGIEGPAKLQTATPAASPSFTELGDIRTMTIAEEMAVAEYASSSTSGWKKRVAGGPFDLTMTVSVYFSDPTALPALGTVLDIKAFVDATLFWRIMWGKVSDVGGFVCDRETGAIVGANITFKLTGFTDISSTPTGGKVLDPATTAIWDGST